VQKIAVAFLLGTLAILAGCGGGSSSPSSTSSNSNSGTISGANVLPVTVDAGPTTASGAAYLNGLFASVVICVPGSSTCQTVDHVLVDTGSEGLRVLASAITLPLATELINNTPVAECVQYADGSFNWGSVRTADVKLSGEVASSIPIQVAGDMSPSTIPTNCSTNSQTGGPGTEIDTITSLGANGILGVGPFRQDCGPNCPSSTANLPPQMYFPYYVCASGGTCQPTAVSLSQQLQNPVWMFPQDNNGVIVELPSMGSSGAVSVAGSLVFGIGTQSNNGLNGAKVVTTDSAGNITTAMVNNGQTSTYGQSFIDSGSNAYFFPDDANIATCTNTGTFGSGITSFYCPSSTLSLSAANSGQNGTSNSVPFSVANAETLFATNSGNNNAFNNVAGTNPPGGFDWGLPFFFGKNVFTAIELQSTPGGTGPYFAY
jgi:Protein of unknown function (DUF3443)